MAWLTSVRQTAQRTRPSGAVERAKFRISKGCPGDDPAESQARLLRQMMYRRHGTETRSRLENVAVTALALRIHWG